MWMRLMVRPQFFVVVLVLISENRGTEEFNHALALKHDKICPSMDIRNNVDALRLLAGCHVVEGFVQIVLFDKANEREFENITFPELREITCYLLLYRVQGLWSIGQLFPNLAVIRGETLLFDYALVVYEMFHLQEIGLWGLTSIERGDVRIEKNPRLCYVNTVDWDLIATGEKVIVENKPQSECSSLVCAEFGCERSLCWGKGHCQKLHQDGCHEMCLGGCTGPGPSKCTVCKHVLVEDMCMNSCPADRYKYLSRCVSESQCFAMRDHHKTSSQSSLSLENALQEASPNFWTFNQTCVQKCPSGYEENHGPNGFITCIQCQGRCLHDCVSSVVNSIADAQNLRGCTYINGSLEINILRGKQILQELEASLSMIEEIHGYLKVARSFPLISLNFLKSLRVIHGNILDNGKHSLVVLDNENLQELWDWDSRPNPEFKIKNGRLFFHFNPKLCRSHIDVLQEMAGLSNYTNLEVARESNGDKVACNVINLNTNVSIKGSTFVVIEWEPCLALDPSYLLGYIVYYIEAPNQNITAYDGRDACGDNNWKVKDVTIPDDPDYNATTPLRNMNYILTHLDPFTQYAFYVMTYSVTSTGGQSKIKYFTTLPDRPSLPRKLTAISNSSSEIFLHWEHPLHPNGILTHYIISGVWLSVDEQFLGDRNYCMYPMNPHENEDVIPTRVVPSNNSSINDNDTKSNCTCESLKVEMVINNKEEYEENCYPCFEGNCMDKKGDWDKACDDYVHNFLHTILPNQKLIYSNGDKNNSTHQVSAGNKFPETFTHSWPTWGHSNLHNATVMTDGGYKCFYHHVDASRTTVALSNMHYFAEYMIQIIACRKPYNLEDHSSMNGTSCSFASLVTVRTQPFLSADEIDFKHVTVNILNKTIGTVYLQWKEPKFPNGVVVSYHIEYRRTDIEHYKPKTECVTKKQYEVDEGGYVLRNLLPGKYGFRIKCTSLAGDGPFTRTVYLDTEEPSQGIPHEIIIGAGVGTMLIIGCIFIFIYYRRKCYMRKRKLKLIATVNPDYIGSTGPTYVEDEWEVSRDRLELHGELGQGSFGMVYEGLLRPTKIRCAVKMVNENASVREQMEFLNEASVMKSFADAYHVVRLLGVVSHGQPPLVIMELMARGDLKSFLRNARNKPSETPRLARILRMAAEIADGMAYLEASKFVHRDLAARNCMVTEDLTVKIGDFGMTRDIYETDYYRNGNSGLLPVRWMAPESLADGVFSSQSDVWSYGVVLWEMATLAEQPYQGFSNEQVLQYVLDAQLLERPPSCPDVLHELMLICWQWRPSQRPTFLQLLAKLEDSSKLSPLFQKLSFYHSIASQELKTGSAQETTSRNICIAACPPRVTFYHSGSGNDIIVHWAQEQQNVEQEIISEVATSDPQPLNITNNESQYYNENDYVESNSVNPDSSSLRRENDKNPKNRLANGDSNDYMVYPLTQ